MNDIYVFIYNDMADFEISLLVHMLGADCDKNIITLAYDRHPIRSKSGLVYIPERRIKDVVHRDAKGLIIPGGWNGEIRPELIELIRNLDAKKRFLCAICAGPRFLAKAGVLEGISYTTSIAEWTPERVENFKEEDPFPRETFLKERVVRDGHIITAIGMAFLDFAIEVCDALDLFTDEEERKGFEYAIKGNS